MSADILEAYAEGFDAEREVFLGAAATLLLLKADGGAQRFAVKEAVTSGWSADFSEFFGNTTFRVARQDAEFNSAVSESSHLIVTDSENPALNNQLHEISRDSTVPAGADPFWRIRAVGTGKRYVPA